MNIWPYPKRHSIQKIIIELNFCSSIHQAFSRYCINRLELRCIEIYITLSKHNGIVKGKCQHQTARLPIDAFMSRWRPLSAIVGIALLSESVYGNKKREMIQL